MFQEILRNPNFELYLYGGIIVVCSVIVLMGVFKTLLVNRIQNKLARKIVLAFSSILLVFPATFIYCWANSLGMDQYWKILLANALGTILTYWLYENTGLRNLINIIGKTAILKVVIAFAKNDANKDVKGVKEIAKKTAKNLNKEANEMLKSAVDETLKNL